MTSDSDDPRSVECEWRNPHSFKLDDELTAPRVPPFQVSLGATQLATEHGHLKPQRLHAGAVLRRTVKQRLEFRVRDSPPHHAALPGLRGGDGARGRGDRWPVTAVMTRSRTYALARHNMTPTRPSCRRPRCPRWRAGESAEGHVPRAQQPAAHRTGRSCMVTGSTR
ncbi:hypothetical protein QJS66_08930 [Kocuria rhizophila]|nr:hypothetical protein QJS66_08930 [Kocuria rhizophila]